MALTKAQRALLGDGPFVGPRPGSNFWPLLEIPVGDAADPVDGEEVEGLLREGLLSAAEEDGLTVLRREDSHIAECDVECTHVYRVTDAGRAALEADR